MVATGTHPFGGPGPASAPRRGVRRVLDGLVRHCVALGATALVSLLVLIYGLLVMVDIAFSCYSPTEACTTAEVRYTVLIIAAASVSMIAAALATIGIVRGLVHGWPGLGSHRIRLLCSAVLTLPTVLAAAAPGVAWLVDRYRH